MTGPRGHTVVELLLVIALSGVIAAAAFTIWRDQQRFYAAAVARTEGWDAVRAATEILAGELRAVNPAGGDLYALARDSLALRSFVGFGIVCRLEPRTGRWLVRAVSGSFETLDRDSVLVFVEGSPESADDDRWETVHVVEVRRAQESPCADGTSGGLWLRPEGVTEGLRPGAPLRAFRPYVYRTYRDGRGHVWLGRRLRGGTIQPVVGPLRASEDGGLVLEGLASPGRPASVVSEVTLVRITVRGGRAGPRLSASDSASTAVFLRNTGYEGPRP